MDNTIAVVNAVFLFAFVFGLGAVFLRIMARLLAFLRSDKPVPSLLKRDVILIGGLAFPFLLILLARFFQWQVIGQLWWTLLTGIPALAGLYYFIYYEFFIIED